VANRPVFRAVLLPPNGDGATGQDYVCEPYCAGIHTELWKEINAIDVAMVDEQEWQAGFYYDGKINTEPALFYEPHTTYLRPRHLMHHLASFLADHFPTDENDVVRSVNVAGKNAAGFDLPFLKMLPESDLIWFSHRVIDPSILFWEVGNGKLPDIREVAHRAGIHVEKFHTALVDADVIRRAVRIGLGNLTR